ncbi:MAG TPA: ABC transporter ATP-binding protein [Stellaceae bacterium]|nr:ABC transporter ATP-binding protein [Stellaceae bacterium]
MNPAILEVSGLSVALPPGADRPFAVEDAAFELRRGEILCVVGESGSGKSVLSSAIMGAPPKGLRVTSGSIRLGGQELTGLPDRALRRIRGNRIAMIFQEPMAALNPAVPVGKQVEEVFELHARLPAAERRERAVKLLAETHLPDPARIAQAYPHQLSGGQCQRVIIAMALAMEPEVLIADEPTTALDVTTQAQVLKLVRELRDVRGHGILFITHDFGVVADVADRIAVMSKGRIVEIGEASRILAAPEHPYTKSLIAAVPSLTPPPRAPMSEASTEALAVDGVTKRYAGVTALDDVSLRLDRGEILTIVGESGCGKSTLARVIVCLTKPTTGSVTVEKPGEAALDRTARRADRRHVQMIFQDPFGSLNPRRAVGDIIARAAMLGGADRKTATSRAAALLAEVGLSREAYARRPGAFSGGQRQRIGIARALAMEPGFVIADECVSALDVSVQAQILDLLRRLQSELRLGILFITHDLRVAAQLSDRIAVMKGGKIVEEGPAEALLSAPADPYTRRLFEAAPGRGVV